MSNKNPYSHFTSEERRIIFTGITNGSTKAAIAQTIGKNKSSVGKEIKLHRALTHKCNLPLECTAYRKYPFGRNCTPDCPEYQPFHCSSPSACNRCSNWRHCRFNKYTYSPEEAQRDYRATLIDSRQGVNFTVQEAKGMAAIIKPMLAQGLTDQHALNLVLSHVNSSPVQKLGGKSPLELADFMYHDLYEKLYAFGIRQIDKDKIILKPYLLKK